MPEMPQPLDRDAWLARVATSLDLPEPITSDVLEELAGHLDDAAGAYRDAGLDPADADRRAIRAMGDPAALGRDLGKARRRGRFLLAAAGGAVRATITFGIWSWFVLWLAAASVGLLGMLIASAIIHAMGSSTSSYFGGPLGSLATVVISAIWFAWLGRVLPARVARSARRSVRGVRGAVAVGGLLVGSLILWRTVNVTMDDVLAIGLPLGPIAFLFAALRAPGDPSLRLLSRPLVFGALILAGVVATVALALATVTPSEAHGWEADTASIGLAPEDVPVLAAQPWDYSGWHDTVTLTFRDDATAAAIAAQFPIVRAEVWPTTIVDEVVHFGSAPVFTEDQPLMTATQVDWTLPVYRTPITVSVFIVAVGEDGTRVVLESLIATETTPVWRGTLADWWLGPR